MPVYFFGLSQLTAIDTFRAILVFSILHLLVYPASNGYNSYMDKDVSSIGGIKNPMQPTAQLYHVCNLLDGAALLASLFISKIFALCILAYILASRAYSYRGIRLKKYPVAGYATVLIFQGSLTFFAVYHACSEDLSVQAPITGIIAAGLLIGGFYPITQIYQHQQDKADGVRTISMILGYRGTFLFCGMVYSLAMLFLGYLFISTGMVNLFAVLLLFFIPILLYFIYWANRVWRDVRHADFFHTMKMNLLASTCTNLGFITVLIIQYFE
jgi:1,4-dihydroxy-2-naphthoate octaprenyltransferase